MSCKPSTLAPVKNRKPLAQRGLQRPAAKPAPARTPVRQTIPTQSATTS